MDLGLAGTGVLITGGSRGLGRDLALSFAREGANIAICARDAAALEGTAAEILALGVRCAALRADLFQAEDCARVVRDAAAALGRLDAIVNNASTNADKTPRSLEDASDAQLLERIMGKTLAAMRVTRAALPILRAGGGGRIVCLGGTSARSVFRDGEMPVPVSNLPQGLGNAALANFAKHLSEEVAKDNILVNTVHPHTMRTSRHGARIAARAQAMGVDVGTAERSLGQQIPIGRVIETRDVIPLVLLLASPLTGAITGQSIAVDGGAVRAIQY
jgi:3-oxoacyl-[acyl-carrier protein] reductase